MKKISIKNIQQPTPAKWSNLGVALSATSSFIAASAFATQHELIGYIGIGLGVVGIFITTLLS